MKKSISCLGLDVHGETIAAAVAEPGGEVRDLGVVPNRPESVRRLIKKVGPAESLHACYEAGPCGYVLYWQLAELGVKCAVVAPTLVPTKAGDRVKTDRRDARKLARAFWCHVCEVASCEQDNDRLTSTSREGGGASAPLGGATRVAGPGASGAAGTGCVSSTGPPDGAAARRRSAAQLNSEQRRAVPWS